MSTLEVTANEAAEKLDLMMSQIEASQENLATTQEQVTMISDEWEAAWADLTVQASTLLENAIQAKALLIQEVDDVNQSFQNLQSKISAWRNDLESELAETKDAIAQLDEHLDSHRSDLDSSTQDTDEGLNGLKQKAEEVKADLEDILSQVQDYLLNEVTNELETHQDDIDRRASEFSDYVMQDSLPEIDSKAGELAEELEDLLTMLGDKLQEIQQSTEDSAQDSVDQVNQHQGDRLQELLDTAERITQAMQRVGDLISQTGQTIGSFKEKLVSGVKTTNLGATVAVGLLRDVIDILDV